jgi:DNA-binding NarL/FixJ family response regulator
VDHFEGGKPRVQLESFAGSRSIAKELCLSVETISSYRTNILLKTKMKNNAEITHYAIQNKPAD